MVVISLVKEPAWTSSPIEGRSQQPPGPGAAQARAFSHQSVYEMKMNENARILSAFKNRLKAGFV